MYIKKKKSTEFKIHVSMHGSVTENFQRQRNFKIPRRNSEFPCPELLESQESFRRRQIFAA